MLLAWHLPLNHSEYKMTTANTIIDNAFVLNCTNEQALALALLIGMTAKQVKRCPANGTLNAAIGMRLCNEPYASFFNAGKLFASDMIAGAIEHDIHIDADTALALFELLNGQHEYDQRDSQRVNDIDTAYEQASAFNAGYDAAKAGQRASAGKRASNGSKSAKQWLIDLLSQAGASYTLDQLCALTGKSEVNIRTMLSDLRSARYCGNYGVFVTKSTRVAGQTFYSKA